jgi:competence protein ComEC
MALVTFFISRKKGLWIAFFGIILFTLMTGGEASIVRAAIMGSIAILAKYKAKRMDTNNAILGAGVCMVFLNPSVLLFDIGFQLSFLALLGLVYITPIISLLYKNPENNFFGIKENFAQTISAQLAVLPILFYSFGFVSFVSVIANILILSVVPITTFLGFCIAFSSFFSAIFAQIIGYMTYVPLAYQIFVIKFFGSLQWNIEYPMGTWGVLLYYYCIGGILLFIYKKYGRKIKKSY